MRRRFGRSLKARGSRADAPGPGGPLVLQPLAIAARASRTGRRRGPAVRRSRPWPSGRSLPPARPPAPRPPGARRARKAGSRAAAGMPLERSEMALGATHGVRSSRCVSPPYLKLAAITRFRASVRSALQARGPQVPGIPRPGLPLDRLGARQSDSSTLSRCNSLALFRGWFGVERAHARPAPRAARVPRRVQAYPKGARVHGQRSNQEESYDASPLGRLGTPRKTYSPPQTPPRRRTLAPRAPPGRRSPRALAPPGRRPPGSAARAPPGPTGALGRLDAASARRSRPAVRRSRRRAQETSPQPLGATVRNQRPRGGALTRA